MKTSKLMQVYARANLLIDSIYELAFTPNSKVDNARTVDGVCGFVIPIKGQAVYKVGGTRYKLSPGQILHAGPSMPLSKKVVGDENWQYILLHYKVIGDAESKKYLESKAYVISLSDNQIYGVENMVRGLLRLHKNAETYNHLKKKMLLYKLVEYLLQVKHSQGLSSDGEKIDYITEFMKDHLDQPLTMSSLAGELGLSDKSFAYMFTKIIGMSPKKYLMQLRVKEAEHLLLGTDLPVSTIAEQVGIEDALYFSRMFKKSRGLSPSAFRQYFGKSPY